MIEFLRDFKKPILIIFLTAFVFLVQHDYTQWHEIVHEKNCLYRNWNVTNRTYKSIYCQPINPTEKENIEYTNLDVLNEIVASIFFPLLLWTYAICVIFIWK